MIFLISTIICFKIYSLFIIVKFRKIFAENSLSVPLNHQQKLLNFLKSVFNFYIFKTLYC